jgi:hypothetical protein
MDFKFRHHNRMVYPQKHLMIVEDIIYNQKRALDHFSNIFDSDGLVQISLVPGALAAAGIISNCKVNLIILDHDLPEGNGSDLLTWMKKNNINIPVITFSGIPYNNSHMGNLGATYIYNKEDIISGKTDNIIKSILNIEPLKEIVNIAEYYTNTVSPTNIVLPRYWLNSNILIGGNIIDQSDWEHLQKDFGIKAVINVDPRPNDGIQIDNILHCGVNDDGNSFPKETILSALKFAAQTEGPIYIHCHLGMSRSPHFAYAILRANYKMSQEEALAKVKSALPSERHLWGFNQHTNSYIKSIETAILGL